MTTTPQHKQGLGDWVALIISSLIIAGVTVWMLNVAIDEVSRRGEMHTVVNEDRADSPGELPACTDNIAEAGGMCQGPLVDSVTPLPPCPTEDSEGCYWDADTMGNGRGHDVITLGPDGVVEVSPDAR